MKLLIRLGGVIILIGTIASFFYQDFTLKKNGVYTVAEVTSIENGARRGQILTYVFYFNGKKYTSLQSVSSNVSETIVGRYFYLIILPDDPDTNKLLLDKETVKQVYESIKEIGYLNNIQ